MSNDTVQQICEAYARGLADGQQQAKHVAARGQDAEAEIERLKERLKAALDNLSDCIDAAGGLKGSTTLWARVRSLRAEVERLTAERSANPRLEFSEQDLADMRLGRLVRGMKSGYLLGVRFDGSFFASDRRREYDRDTPESALKAAGVGETEAANVPH